MILRQKFQLLLASARIANLPSVVSNVWLGCAFSVILWRQSWQENCWPVALQLGLAGMLLYLSGNFFNDWHDRHWDALHRPERALPQAAFAPPLYLGLAVLCALTGVVLAGLAGMGPGLVAALIVICILIYTRWHKQSAWAVLAIGLCRGLLPLLFLSRGWPGDVGADDFPSAGKLLLGIAGIAPAVLAMILYIGALSLLARGESSRPPASGHTPLVTVMMVLAGLLMAMPGIHYGMLLALPGLLPLWLWLALCFTQYRQPPTRQISALLAGVPLLDWVALLPLALVVMTQAKADPFAITCLLLPPLSFITGRLLQRLAAAT
jgi:4-hydroxybenzoate polyprenyltransferase